MNKRVLKILGWIGAVALLLVVGALVGGGAVYALTQSQAEGPGSAGEPIPTEPGIVIAAVVPDSPAAQAGVKRGDILLKLDGQATDNPAQLISLVQSKAAGSQVQVTVLHGDEERTLPVTLGDRNGQPYLGVFPCGASHAISFRGIGRGATIIEVTPSSPAEQAGLQEGDTIVAVNGQELDAEHQLTDLIAAQAPGDTVTLSVKSPGQEARDVTVTLDEQPNQPGVARLGVQFRPFPDIRDFPGGPRLDGNIERGAFIRQVIADSPAAAAGLNEKDVITAINGELINTPRDLVEAVAARQPGDTLTLSVVASGETDSREVTVTLAEDPNQPGKAYLGVQLGGFFRMQRSDEQGNIDKNIEFFINPEAGLGNLPFDRQPDATPFHFFEFNGSPFEFEWCGEGGSCLGESI